MNLKTKHNPNVTDKYYYHKNSISCAIYVLFFMTA